VVDLATVVFGHLTGVECRRALARGWLIVVRTLAGGALALIALSLLWIWWLSVGIDPAFVPGADVRIALGTSAVIMLTIVVVMAPAVLAGSLAGERERGVLQLLLTTSASPREIVLGRLLGKLSQVGMILLAGVPLIALLAAWAGLGPLELLVLCLLLAAVAFGGGGLGVGASVVSRRGRDALLAVYLIILLLLLGPFAAWLGVPTDAAPWLESLNPFLAMGRLVQGGDAMHALLTVGLWLALGITGSVIAAWRLRPSSLTVGVTVKTLRRRGRVRPLGDRPMLWKELYIERVGTIGRFGRWLGILITVAFGGGSLTVAGIVACSIVWRRDTAWADGATRLLGVALDGPPGLFLGWLLQWAIGLRAAVSIASERERGTWDALLMSPLAPGEIIQAKVYGSLHALRWMIAALALAWTVGAVTEAVAPRPAITWIAGNFAAGALMAAVGVRASLSLPTGTKAMTWTIALWLVSHAVVSVLALSLISIGILFFMLLWSAAIQFYLVPLNTAPWFPMTWNTAWPLATNAVTWLIAVLVVVDTSLRFDRIAGRMAGGKVASAVDAWLHGQPAEPILLAVGRKASLKAPSAAAAVAPGVTQAGDFAGAD
jgi:ABC-type transport system involved in multi-copper enzyme maturation permease subunit